MNRFIAFFSCIALCHAVSAFSPGPDLVVAADGSGNCRTIQEAMDSLPTQVRERKIVLVRNGVYREKILVNAHCVTLRGESRGGTRIEFPQLNDEFNKTPDRLGRGVVNVEGDDFVLENITVANTAGQIGPHAFALYGKGDRTVVIDSDVLSEGADTVSLWKGESGRYYHARCHFRGSVDFVCPRGWCYMTDCDLFEVKDTAAIWHDGKMGKDMKFVIRRCRIDGVQNFVLSRHHADAQFYFLDCVFSEAMRDRAPARVIYPLNGEKPSPADLKRNADYDKINVYGERCYFSGCRREGGNYSWHADNLSTAEGSPKPGQITAKWTFGGTWDPERSDGPRVVKSGSSGTEGIELIFSESVTVKGRPALVFPDGRRAEYSSGSGTDRLVFSGKADSGEIKGAKLDFSQGGVFASEASATLRQASADL
jgi:pectinesterase